MNEIGCDWYSRYRWLNLEDTCGACMFFLAERLSDGMSVLVKHSKEAPGELAPGELAHRYADESRLYLQLQKQGIINYFDCFSGDGKFFLVFDIESARKFVCTNLDPELQISGSAEADNTGTGTPDIGRSD